MCYYSLGARMQYPFLTFLEAGFCLYILFVYYDLFLYILLHLYLLFCICLFLFFVCLFCSIVFYDVLQPVH